MKVAVVDRTNRSWTSGSEYTRAQVAALTADHGVSEVEVSVLAQDGRGSLTIAGAEVTVRPLPVIPEPRFVGRQVDRMLSRFGAPASQSRQWREWADSSELDVMVSFLRPGDWWRPSGVATCMWVWDLQHRVLPSMFPQQQLDSLDWTFTMDAERGDLIVVSSEASRDDFREFLPQHAHKVRVYHFPSRFAFDSAVASSPPTSETLARYGVEDRFLLVVNQFWQHKNHDAVVEACGLLKQRHGDCPQVVMIGLPIDDRDPSGRYISNLMAKIAAYRLEGRVKMLGFVPSADRDDLFRTCTALVQPSRFEGWNTSIEDAKAIGLPVIASDLAVHREQLADPIGFFDCDDVERLADLMLAGIALPGGPQTERERAALVRHGRSLRRSASVSSRSAARPSTSLQRGTSELTALIYRSCVSAYAGGSAVVITDLVTGR